MITTITAKTPPTTADGIAASNADNLPKNPKITNQIPAATNTLRLATPVIVAAGIWFVILGFFGKLSALLAAIPSAVVGGVFAVIVVIIMLSGLNVIGDLNMTGNKGYVIGVQIGRAHV